MHPTLRQAGFCKNQGCEDVGNAVLLPHLTSEFVCPSCMQKGVVQVESGGPRSRSLPCNEVQVEFGFDVASGFYRHVAVVRDESFYGKRNVYTYQTPFLQTEKRALERAEAILGNLSHYREMLTEEEIHQTTEFALSLDDDMDVFRAGLCRLAEQWVSVR